MPILPADAIFISYSRRDDETMRKITFFLRDQGFKVWVDNEKLIPGTPAWEESIEDAIKKAFAVIVILSPDSKNSEWVRREITYADQFDKRVFPVLIKGDEDDSLPIRLVTRQYVDLRKNEEAGLTALSAAINFYIDEKQTLEMKRPHAKKEVASTPPSTAASLSRIKTAKPSNKWILPAGIFLSICVLGLWAIWAGYRLYSKSIPVTGSDSGEPTFTASVPTETTVFEPTDMPIPTKSNVPTTDLLSQFLNNVQVLEMDTFDDPLTDKWTIISGTIDNSVLEIIGNNNFDGVFSNRKLGADEGVVIDFNYSQASLMEMFVDYGEYDSDTYKRFGFYIEDNNILVNERGGGNTDGTGFSGNLTLEPDTDYSVLIAILPNAEYLEVIWDPSDPSKALSYREKMDQTWLNLNLTFFIQAGNGTIRLDNYREISFSSAK